MLCGVERDLALSEREPEPPFDVHGSCTDGFHCAITVASGCNGLVHRNRAEETHERVTHIFSPSRRKSRWMKLPLNGTDGNGGCMRSR